MPRLAASDPVLAVTVQAWLLLTLILLVTFGGFLMRRFPVLACLAAVGLLNAGCAALPGGDKGVALLKEINQHIEKCERHYTGGTGVGAALTFRIDCPAEPAALAP